MGRKPLGSAGFGARVLQARMMMSARVGRVVSQTELGETLGVTGVTIGRWEEGGREPSSLGDLERLAEALGVRAAWLAFGDGPPDRDGPPVKRL
jgi:transcriptional regulator with XRE-family HTH domain